MSKIPRNKPCPCGSGKKYKNCCLKKDRYLKNLPDDALKRLKEEFSKYNQKDLIETLVALSICPENQSQYIRLEIATQIACSNINCGEELITIPNLNKLFLKYLPSHGPIGQLEDPLDTLFTTNIIFFKNNLLFNAPSSYESYVLQKILNCIHSTSSTFSKEFMNYFYQSSMFILSLSDYIVKITDHERYEIYEDRFREEIFIPSKIELEHLKKSVTFKTDELKKFKESLKIPEDIGNDFIIEVGDEKFNDILSGESELKETLEKINALKDFFKVNMYSEFSDKNPLLKSPIIKIEDTYIIFPRLLVVSLRHAILSNTIKIKETENFMKNYQEYLWSNILFNLKNKLDFEKFDYNLPEWKNTIFKDEIFKIDNDKVAYCILINDNLKQYGKIGPCERIDLKYESILKDRIDSVINDLNSHESINDVLIILFIGMSGRQYYTNIPKNSNLLTINCEEFDILVKSGNYDSLTLFKFAKLLDKSDIKGIGFLDKFSVYIKHHHSFYLDDKKIDSIFLSFDLTSDYTKKLRKKAIKDKDPHIERYGDKFILVNKVNEFIYAANPNLFLIKLINQNIWIECKNYIESNIAKAIGYWIWQFSDELHIDLKTLNNHPVYISIDLEEHEDLDLNIEITDKIKENLIISSHVSETEIKLKISKNLLIIANQKDNEADLLLMNEILGLVGILLEKNGLKNTLTKKRIMEIIHKKAQLGLKKHILIYDSENIMNIPVKNSIRLLQEHDIQINMDNLVNKVDCEFDFNQKLTKGQSLELSHKIVKYYLDNIKKELVKYDWDDLMQKLIINYENILFARSFTSTSNMYYLNNYDDSSSILKDIVNDDHELDKLGLPTRTLIEILSAEQNFNSEMKISNESFDNLMALSNNYIEWAFASDYINSEYIDFEITPLESGRIGIETNLNDILDTFRTKRILEHVNNLSENILHENNGGKAHDNEIDEAFKSEFGISLTDYAEFVSALISLAEDEEKDIIYISKSKLIDIMKEELEWSDEKSIHAIENFSLSPREKWEKPPIGFDETDIYPWIFRRRLSYYLKPLIIKDDNDETIIYGLRNVYHSCFNLMNLILKGLYKTDDKTSKKFKRFMGKMLNKKGKEFNEHVFKWFKENLESTKKFNFKIWSNVKIDKIARVEPKLGDIDVLLLDNDGKRLFSIECKDVESAKNPRQIAQEIEKFFNKKYWIKKHQKRDEWIKNNLDKLGIKIEHDLKDYKVFSIFIASQELPTIYLTKTPIEIVPFSQTKSDGVNFLDKYKYKTK